MNYIIGLMIFTKFLSLSAGLIITYLSYKISKRYDNKFMLTLSAGFLFISLGSFFELILNGLNLDIYIVHLVESVVLFIGMGIIVYTLILREP